MTPNGNRTKMLTEYKKIAKRNCRPGSDRAGAIQKVKTATLNGIDIESGNVKETENMIVTGKGNASAGTVRNAKRTRNDDVNALNEIARSVRNAKGEGSGPAKKRIVNATSSGSENARRNGCGIVAVTGIDTETSR